MPSGTNCSNSKTPLFPPPFPDWGILWHQISREWVSSKGTQKQSSELTLGRQGIQLQKKDSGNWRGRKWGPVGRLSLVIQSTCSQSVVCGTLKSLRPFLGIYDVKTIFIILLRYCLLSQYIGICTEVKLCKNWGYGTTAIVVILHHHLLAGEKNTVSFLNILTEGLKTITESSFAKPDLKISYMMMWDVHIRQFC